MALTTVPSATVKSTLGASMDEWSQLITHNSINRWSKYKPVRGDWPYDVNYFWGFDLSAANPNKWGIIRPRGGITYGEPFRAGDFRGYEHDRTLAYPSIQCRDTDNAWEANLYPSGTPYLQRWYCRAHRSASSVIIIPSDLGFDNYYVGLKVSAGGTWYKTFGQVKDLTFAKSWNISISTEITTWVGEYPAFSNFPYHVGAVDWQLIICSTAASAWTASAPSNIVYFTGIADGGAADTWDTDGTNKYISRGSFTIKDWIKLSSYSLTFNPPASSSDVTVYCSTANLPAFTISDNKDWITLAVYSDGSLVANPALYAPGMQVRVSVTAVSDVSSVTVYKDASDATTWTMNSESGSVSPALSRGGDGTVTITSEGVDAEINVAQGAGGSTALSFTYNPSGGDDFPPSSGTIEYVIKRGMTQVYPSSGWATAIGQRAEDDNTVNIADIGETALNTDYAVYIRLVL